MLSHLKKKKDYYAIRKYNMVYDVIFAVLSVLCVFGPLASAPHCSLTFNWMRFAKNVAEETFQRCRRCYFVVAINQLVLMHKCP